MQDVESSDKLFFSILKLYSKMIIFESQFKDNFFFYSSNVE